MITYDVVFCTLTRELLFESLGPFHHAGVVVVIAVVVVVVAIHKYSYLKVSR